MTSRSINNNNLAEPNSVSFFGFLPQTQFPFRMAIDLQKGDSLFLPSQFVTPSLANKPINQNWPSWFPSSDSGPALSSPVESDFGSTESESDQDDGYTAELTRQMAYYMLEDDDTRHEQSGLNLEEVAMAEKFEEFNTSEDMHKHVNGEKVSLSGRSPEHITAAPPMALTVRNSNTSSTDFHSKQATIDNQIRAIRFSKQKQEQIMKQQRQKEFVLWGKDANRYHQPESKQQFRQLQSKSRASAGFTNKEEVSCANLQWQQRHGSEMRAIFLGKSGSNSRSTGTGVFLPRGIRNTSYEPRKKPGCSTVLIPGRVVQALKLHFDKMGVPARLDGACFTLQHKALQDDVRYDLQLQQKRRSRTVPTMDQEIGLPQDWTY